MSLGGSEQRSADAMPNRAARRVRSTDFFDSDAVHQAYRGDLVKQPCAYELAAVKKLLKMAEDQDLMILENEKVRGSTIGVPDFVEKRDFGTSAVAVDKELLTEKAEQLYEEHKRNAAVQALALVKRASKKRHRGKPKVPARRYSIGALGGRWVLLPKAGDPQIGKNSMRFSRSEGAERVEVGLCSRASCCWPWPRLRRSALCLPVRCLLR